MIKKENKNFWKMFIVTEYAALSDREVEHKMCIWSKYIATFSLNVL